MATSVDPSISRIDTSSNLYDSSSYQDYESVRALDQYGNAIQLQHAQAAADQQGRWLLVLQIQSIRQEDTNNNNHKKEQIWIVSYAKTPSMERRLYHSHRIQPKSSSSKAASTVPRDRLMTLLQGGRSTTRRHQTQRTPTATTTTTVAMACTGVQPDAIWLQRQLQLYIKSIWERYGSGHAELSHSPSSTTNTNTNTNCLSTISLDLRALANAVALLKRNFWGHDNDQMEKWYGPAWNAAGIVTHTKSQSKDRQQGPTHWARPLGIRTILVSTTTTSNGSSQVLVIEPSGSIWQSDRDVLRQKRQTTKDKADDSLYPMGICAITSVGKDHVARHERLVQQLQKRKVDTDNDHLESVENLLRQVYLQQDEGSEEDELIVEILASDGTLTTRRITTPKSTLGGAIVDE